MKAIVYRTYGSPDVLELQEVAKPVPKEHEILIHVRATVVTPADIAFRKGCLLYTSPSPRDRQKSRMPSSA